MERVWAARFVLTAVVVVAALRVDRHVAQLLSSHYSRSK